MKRVLLAVLALSLLSMAQEITPKSGGIAALTDSGTVVTSTEPFRLQNGAVGTPSYSFTNSTNSGMYSRTTNFTTFSSAGTGYFEVGAQSGVGAVVAVGLGFNGSINGSADSLLTRLAAGTLVFGNGVGAAAPVSYIVQFGDGATGADKTGGIGTIRPGYGTSAGAGNKLSIQRNLMAATGSVAQSQVDSIVSGQSKTLSNTSATAQSLANISVPSNSAGGASGFITVTCTDGTNFDSETQSFNVSYVNKATVLTVGSPAITASTAANNSGSCTVGMTAVAGTNSVDIKVTPVFTTIVPTTVTSYIELFNHGTGNVTIQ